ncbi:MAG: DNA replication protein [Alphaproteobacteria bacterium]|nr:DNA replication protein [Alphaproteobacteria bacterium]
MTARQFVLDLGYRPALDRDDFLVSSCNGEAANWIDRWPEWPAPARGLALVGPAGCGKTHLGAVWRARSGAALVIAADMTVEGVPDALGDARHALVDDLEQIGQEQALLHLYNTVAERSGSVLILSRVAPSRLPIALADLASRLATLPVVTIGVPDEALLAGVLVKHFTDRQVTVREDVVAYLVARMERSFDAAYRLVDRLDRMALAERGKVTTILAGRALAEDENDTEHQIDQGD